jgi:hypothetical protein
MNRMEKRNWTHLTPGAPLATRNAAFHQAGLAILFVITFPTFALCQDFNGGVGGIAADDSKEFLYLGPGGAFEALRYQSDGDWVVETIGTDSVPPDPAHQIIGYQSEGNSWIAYIATNGSLIVKKREGRAWSANSHVANGLRPGTGMSWYEGNARRQFAFQSADNRHIHELCSLPGEAWRLVDLHTVMVALPASARSPVIGFCGGNQKQIIYLGENNHVLEMVGLYADDTWHYVDLTNYTNELLPGSCPKAKPYSPLIAFDCPAMKQIYFISGNGHIQEMCTRYDSGKWQCVDLTAFCPDVHGRMGSNPAARADSPLVGFAWGDVKQVYFIDENGHIQEMCFAHGEWRCVDFTSTYCCPTAADGSHLIAFDWNGRKQLYYIEKFSGALIEMCADFRKRGWHFSNLSWQLGAPYWIVPKQAQDKPRPVKGSDGPPQEPLAIAKCEVSPAVVSVGNKFSITVTLNHAVSDRGAFIAIDLQQTQGVTDTLVTLPVCIPLAKGETKKSMEIATQRVPRSDALPSVWIFRAHLGAETGKAAQLTVQQ